MINISDYNRTGIFIEENVTTLPAVTAPTVANVHFVPGFSKKSTVFNRPVLITSDRARKAYFGDIDRTLEKKGSFFHRTIDIALQTAPVYAMNLLKTNSDDTLDYASISLSAQFDNDQVRPEEYDKFFNKAGFWVRDTESFLFFAKNATRKIHFTNVSDKKITFFMFKTSLPAFDVTAEVWYSNIGDDRPLWISPKSLMNDYMVRVVAVVGDFTNYSQLTVDTTYGKYFSTSGLRKNMVDGFIRERGVSLLGDYTGSVIPYFQDTNRTVMFIESLINNETDRTGLFCAIDIDSVNTDYNTGVIDLIGESLVGIEKDKINFMSYSDTIEEIDIYESVNSDNSNTTDLINGASLTFNNSTAVSHSTVNFSYTNTDFNINNNGTFVQGQMSSNLQTYNPVPVNLSFTTGYRTDIIYVTQAGIMDVSIGQETSTATPNGNYPNGAIVLAVIEMVYTSADKTVTTKDVIGNTITGFTNFDITPGVPGPNTYVGYSFDAPTGEIEFSFNITSTNKTDYFSYLSKVLYDMYNNNLSLNTSYMEILPGIKTWLKTGSITKDDLNYLITITGLPENALTSSTFEIIYTDKQTDATSPSGSGYYGFTSNLLAHTNDRYYAGSQSEMIQDFKNGMINTGDYLYESYGSFTVRSQTITTGANIGNYIVFDNSILVNAGSLNGLNIILSEFDNSIIDLGGTTYTSTTPVGTDLGLAVNEIALVTNSAIIVPSNVYDILDADLKVYLKMYSVADDVFIDFYGESTLITPVTMTKHIFGSPIKIYSGDSNYEQTLEVVKHNAYIQTDTKFLIDMTRYAEVKVGDYVKAYYDINDLEYPDEQPKKFARIIKKTAWSGNIANNVQYAEITVDVKADIKEYVKLYDGVLNTVYQTTRYTSIETYVDTYKGISLKGFQVQQTSIPDGTETRLTEILSVIEKDSSLYNALVNKQKFSFRYLIDSFGLGLTEFSKQTLADITGKRKNAISFINAPSAKMFRQSTNPSFINVDGTLNMEYVKKGGNEEQNPSFLYSFAQGSGKDDGRDTSAYFFPYVTVNDNGRPLSFPPAVYAANTYMRKNNSTLVGKYNFTVAAGVNDGLILGIANTEMDFTEQDYVNADAMGLNLLSYHANYGYYIETEYTAMVSPKTPLSNLHTRELLIDMENEMYAMLFKYQYQFNIPVIREKIKREADDICQKYYDRGGITYFLNVIDETNNTAELIDNQFGLLETTIVPVSAMAKIVNIFNVTTNGALAGATGFQ